MSKIADNNKKNLINSLYIRNFRNHDVIELSSIGNSVVVLGCNGSGKTSILEAISTFSNSRGLRNSKFPEMLKRDRTECLIELELKVDDLMSHQLKSTFNKEKKSRRLFLNENEIKSFQDFRKNISMLWLTPYTDRIFTGSSSSRRSFFDGIVINFDYSHAIRLSEYDKFLKQRSKILKDEYKDDNWINILEDRLAKLSVAISCSRLDILFKIKDALTNPLIEFPKVEVSYHNSLENQLLDFPAIEIEEKLKKNYLESRELDRLLGGSQYGCQRSDIIVANLNTDIMAKMSSSGEQQAILISLIIAASKALKKSTNFSPILLLDEVFIHLDEIRKVALLREIEALDSQAWITTTEKEKFLLSKKFCYYNLHNKDIKI